MSISENLMTFLLRSTENSMSKIEAGWDQPGIAVLVKTLNIVGILISLILHSPYWFRKLVSDFLVLLKGIFLQ